MKNPALMALGTLLVLTQAPGTILLNEIHINPPQDLDLNYEFIELRSHTDGVEACTGLTLLIIENNGGSVGEIEEALDLSSFSTGTNGLLLIGNGYFPDGGPWTGSKPSFTTTADPVGTEPGVVPPFSGLGDDDIDPNGGLTFLLVSGWTGMINATGSSLGDVDVNNTAGVDWLEPTKPPGSQQSQPYATLVDSIGFRDTANSPVRLPYTSADLNTRPPPGTAPTYAPDNISRRRSRANVTADPNTSDQNKSSAWYGANLFGTAADTVTYDTIQWFGEFRGQATPGQPNLDAAPVPGVFLINEVSIDPSGTEDGNFEFIEIINTQPNNGSFASSLQGYSLLLIGTTTTTSGADPSTLGKIVEAWDLGAMSTGPNGLLLLGNGYASGAAPWGKSIDPQTQLGDPSAPAPELKYSDMGSNDIGKNDGFTLLLVRGYVGTINQTVGNAAGVLTAQPWALPIVDSVGFDEVDEIAGTFLPGKSYAPAKVDGTFVENSLTKHYSPDALARKLGTATANSAAAWYGGELAARNSNGIGFQNGKFIGGFWGTLTPGRTNLSAPPAPGAVRINEVHLNPPTGTPDSTEYVELINPDKTIVSLYDHWLLVVGATAGDRGVVHGVLDLRGMSTGPNGLAIFGDGIEESGDWVPYIPGATLRDDPRSFNADATQNNAEEFNFDENFLDPNNGVSFLLVRGWTGTLPQDLDPDDNGTFNVVPWTQLVDSIGFGLPVDPTVQNLTFNGFPPEIYPGNLSRYNDRLAENSAAAWLGGELQRTVPLALSTAYTTNRIGPFEAAASPGRYNHTATPNDTAKLLLNELNINPPTGDNNNEFIELTSNNRQAISTNNYTLLLLDVSGTEFGSVLEAWSLDGMSTGPNGLLLTGSGYTSVGGLPWTESDAIAPDTSLGAPAGMNPDDIGRATDNGALTVLLVKNFTGRPGDDLDPNNLGLLPTDVSNPPAPWTELVDSVGLTFWDELAVQPGPVGRVYGAVDLSQTGYTPDNVSRYLDNLAPQSEAAWYGGDILGTTAKSLAYDTAEVFPPYAAATDFLGAVTPGQPNLTPNEVMDDLGDEDQDGVVNLLEVALVMDPNVPDAHKLPDTGTLTVAGTTYPILKYTRPPGGTTGPPNKYTGVNGLFYTVQFSTDLSIWTETATSAGTSIVSLEPPIESATYVPTPAALAQGQAAGQMFMRLRVSRQ